MTDAASLDSLPPNTQDSGVRWCAKHHQRKQSCIRGGYAKRECEIVPLFFLSATPTEGGDSDE